MPRLAIPLLTALSLVACSVLPDPAPRTVEHDLGAPFVVGAAKGGVPLKALSVNALPTVSGVSMYYREAADPTRRGAYAYNRWAAPPAAMIDGALNRLLAVDGSGRCRLQVTLAEFIIDVDAAGAGRGLLSASLRLTGDAGSSVQTVLDEAVPMSKVDPAAGALALREAVARLGTDTSRWLAGDAGRACR